MFNSLSFIRRTPPKTKPFTYSRTRRIALFFLLFLFSCAYPSQEMIYDEDTYYQELRGKVLSIDHSKPHHYAIVINSSIEMRHQNNVSLAYQVLIENGFSYPDIFIFDIGGEQTPIYPLTSPLRKDALIAFLIWAKTNITENDTLLVYITGHGLESSLPLSSFELIKKKTLDKLFQDIHPKFFFIFVDICYWGTETFQVPKNGIIITTANDKNTSYGDGFPRLFWGSFRENRKMTIIDAFYYAKDHNMATSMKRNDPHIMRNMTGFVDLTGNSK